MKIAIIGAGLAGLTCGYELKKMGIDFDIYEGNSRVGGRCYTIRDTGYHGNQHTEMCGEYINSNHKHILKLMNELGIEIIDVKAYQKEREQPTAWIDGREYPYKAIQSDLRKPMPQLKEDLKAVGVATCYNNYTERGLELDHMPVTEYITQYVEGGLQSPLGQLLKQAMVVLFGEEIEQISALNFVYTVGSGESGNPHYFGNIDERYTAKEGNDFLVKKLVSHLKSHLFIDHELIEIQQDNRCILTFANGVRKGYDYVVLTIPFSVIRKSVNIQRAKFRPIKIEAIHHVGMGRNGRFTLQFTKKYWEKYYAIPDVLTTLPIQNFYHATVGQPGECGILMCYLAGDKAEEMLDKPIEIGGAEMLSDMEKTMSGICDYYNDVCMYVSPIRSKWSYGSYSYYKIGQMTKYCGLISEREGNIFFAGEHTSIAFQGFMNGAVQSGMRVAKEIYETVRKINVATQMNGHQK